MGVYWVRPPIRMNVVGENPGRATDRRKATAFPKVGDLGFSGFPSDFTSLGGIFGGPPCVYTVKDQSFTRPIFF